MNPGTCALAVGAGSVALLLVVPWAARPRAVARADGPAAPEPGVPRWFEAVVAALDLPVDPSAAWAGTVLAGLAGAAWLLLVAPVGAVAVALGIGSAARAVRWARRRITRGGPSDDILLGMLTAAQATLASGGSLALALERGGASSSEAALELGPVLAEVQAGGLLQAALDRWAVRRPGTGVGLVVDALSIASATGASQARALGAVADTLRDRRARAREVRALASQARLSSVVLVVLPMAFAFLAALSDPAVARFTTATPAGWACVAVGLLLDGAGAWWMAALVRGVR